ncbi:MAG: histidine--tRNA ligase [Candidatus Kaiserbacteria bacterium]|nr:histidine--tRNA ligase [Candidatus Kaiserbacteria bacterium]MCB9816207.1 histidine--tRNA ligase [Candidatus Nomurabacteria bacterium]
MSDNKLSTDSYKGVRDFYPEDMAIQRYIFQTWSKTAESFGFERYDASILEPSALYKAKGAENEEMVNEQTYTFIDRGDREVTLRPEMTPTVARMVAGQRHELTFPLRWYSIPNLFRYERPQRGRLREHWQLNCDMFGAEHAAADVEMIALAHKVLTDFGATPDMFEIKLNNRQVYSETLLHLAKSNDEEITNVQINAVIRHSDRIGKISPEEFTQGLVDIVGEKVASAIVDFIHNQGISDLPIPSRDKLISVAEGLSELGIKNVSLEPTLARGFDYYTGTIFEIFDTSDENNRALLGGGRYDNLTGMFGGEAIPGIGFGMGDVTMRDFLETHKLIPEYIRTTAPQVMVIPMETEQNLYAEGVAMKIRQAGHKVATDIGTRKVGKKIGSASDRGVQFVIVIGDEEMQNGNLTVKNLLTGEEQSGRIGKLMNFLDTK